MSTNDPSAPRAVSASLATSFQVEGMTCASCVARVEREIRALPGVASASVNLATERATVEFAGRSDPSGVIAAIAKAGYETRQETIELQIEGMTCASCVSRIEKALATVPGVVSASVNLATEKASVVAASGAVTRAALEATVRATGYEVVKETSTQLSDEHDDRRERELRHLRNSLGLAVVLTVPLFVMEMGSHYVPTIHDWIVHNIGMTNNLYIQFVLATVVLFGPGLRFFQKGIPNLLRLAPNMNSLVVLGTSAAWGYSVVATFFPSVLPRGAAYVYYEAAAVIVALILLGRYLEARAKGRTSQAIQRLIGLQPKTARVVRNGAVLELPLEQVVVGDEIEIRPGRPHSRRRRCFIRRVAYR